MNLVSNVVSLSTVEPGMPHGCARALIMARHNALARDLCAFAQEADQRAACDQTAVELRPPERKRQGDEAEEDGGRATRAADIRIELDGDQWESLHVDQQAAIIDRELQSFAVAKDAEDGVILDSHGRPKLKRRLPDFEVSIYTAIASRHKEASIEAISMAQIYQQAGQAVFPFLGQQEFAALPDPDAAEPEGKKKKGKK
jgi:hypothetical protein